MIMSNAGTAIMGIGSASGDGRATAAAKMAVTSPLLEASIEGARGILLNIAGGPDLGLFEVNEAAEIIHAAAHPDANIIFGQVIDEGMGDEVRVTVIAAGFDRWDGAAGGQPAHEAAGGPPAGRRSAWSTPKRRWRPPVSVLGTRTISTSPRSSSSPLSTLPTGTWGPGCPGQAELLCFGRRRRRLRRPPGQRRPSRPNVALGRCPLDLAAPSAWGRRGGGRTPRRRLGRRS